MEQGAQLGELINQAEPRQAKVAQTVAFARQLRQERADGDQGAAVEVVIDKELGL